MLRATRTHNVSVPMKYGVLVNRQRGSPCPAYRTRCELSARLLTSQIALGICGKQYCFHYKRCAAA